MASPPTLASTSPLAAPAQTFDTIVGQDLVRRFLLRATEQGRLPQAILFAGPRGVGKRSLMYAMAKHLATSHLASPEAVRKAMGKIERGTHPDVIFIEPKSASGQILKAQVDEMHERAYFAPLESPYKVIAIAPVEALNLTSANNLLKLLEEPPKNLYLLLACEQTHRVLTTIRSRCALLRCSPVGAEELAEWLMTTVRCARRRAAAAARLSGGRPGLALALISGEEGERRRQVRDELDFLREKGFVGVFRVARRLSDIAGGAPQAISVLLVWFRDLLVQSLVAGRAGDVGASKETSASTGDADAMTGDATASTEAARAAAAAARASAAEAEALLINQDMAEEIREAAARPTVEGLGRAIEALLRHQRLNLRPSIDADLLMHVVLTEVGAALKEG
jgi:DNA polymerase-3 subunit delta'